MDPQTKTKKKPLPMDERAVRALAALLEGATDTHFDEALNAMVGGLKDRIRKEWQARRARRNISKIVGPVERVLAAEGDAEAVVKALLDDPTAVAVLRDLTK